MRQCPACQSDNPGLLTGDKSQFNPRNEAGVQVCTPCKIQEKFYGGK
jgi:hypothetical protein